jgi:hypothetical protein
VTGEVEKTCPSSFPMHHVMDIFLCAPGYGVKRQPIGLGLLLPNGRMSRHVSGFFHLPGHAAQGAPHQPEAPARVIAYPALADAFGLVGGA